MAELLALGVSHKTAPLELRERLALTEGRAVGMLGELVEREEVLEAAAISTCNRTELYLYAADPVGAEAVGARPALARGRDPADRARRPPLLAARLRGGRAPAPGHRRARLDDHRRGRDPGPGQARLRARAGRGRDRPDPQPPLPRGARRRQAGPLGDRDLASARCRSPRSRSSSPSGRSASSSSAGCWSSAPARRPSSPRGRWRPRACRRSSSPTATTTARSGSPSASRGRPCASRSCPRRWSRADIVVTSTSSPHQVIEREALAEVMAAREGRPLLLIDLAVPRDIHPACREVAGGQPLRHGRPAGAGRAKRLRARGRGAPRRGDPARRARRASSAGSRPQDVTPTVAALRERADEIVERVLAENEAAGRGSPRPTASACALRRGRSPRASCTSRPCA